jgi:hypothetical protein
MYEYYPYSPHNGITIPNVFIYFSHLLMVTLSSHGIIIIIIIIIIITFILINLKLLIIFVHNSNVLCYVVLSYHFLVISIHLRFFVCLLFCINVFSSSACV